MGNHTTTDSLSSEEWNTAQRLVEVVRQNDFGAEILIYFENDFSAINGTSPLDEMITVPPIESTVVKALAKKKLINLKFCHRAELLYVVELRKQIFAAVDAGLKRGVDSLY